MFRPKSPTGGVSDNAYLLLITTLAACTGASCYGSGDNADEGPVVTERVPLAVEVAGGAMEAGFAVGILRMSVEVSSFRIMKHPTTRADYRACVAAGACEEVGESSCARSAFETFGPYSLKADKAPLTCLAPQQARNYCEWIGGRLPTLAEWQFAARGPTPQRYPWGSEAPNCDQHPRAIPTPEQANEPGARTLGRAMPCLMMTDDRSLLVGRHPAGASASGVEDLLITPGELLSTDANAQFSACRAGFEACIVYGLHPGAVDSVAPVRPSIDGSNGPETLKVYSFRCVMEG